MKLSIVVPAYNAEETLERCLASISKAVEGEKECEVIVVDDGSTDRTPEIAARFPVRLIRLDRNEGRIRARERGAREAKSDKLLFVDARILIPTDTIKILENLDHEPAMGSTAILNVRDGNLIDRFFFLLRKRIYSPYYPQGEDLPVLVITPENFHRAPKGTTMLFVDKGRFLDSLPKDRSRYVNDDTRMLEKIVREKEIRVPRELAMVYIQRENPGDMCRHIYERGPRFAEYYLRPGMRYYSVWVAACIVFLLFFFVIFLSPTASYALFLLVLFSILAVSYYLAETTGDFFRMLLAIPLVSLFFGLGILKGKIRVFLVRLSGPLAF